MAEDTKTNGKTDPALEAAKKAEEAERNALFRKQHARRLSAALGAGYTVTGLRLSDPKSDHANGVVVTFDDAEQKKIVDAVRGVLEARK